MDEKEHDEQLDEIDFSIPWEDETLIEEENETPIEKDEIDYSTPWEEEIFSEEQEKISLEKEESKEEPIESIVIQQEIPDPEPEQQEVLNSEVKPEQQKKTASVSSLSYQPHQAALNEDSTFSPKPQPGSRAMIVVISFLTALILILIAWFLIRSMFQGRVNNVAEYTAEESPIQTETAQMETVSAEVQRETLKMLEVSTEATTLPATEAVLPAYHYTVVIGKASWEAAEAKAVEMGGHLVSIHSEEEWYAVLSAVNQAKDSYPNLKYVWLGAVSDLNKDSMTVTFYWSDGSDNSWLMNANAHWYYNTSLGLSEPSGYDIHAYQKDGSLIREPYLMLWLPDNNITWSLNDEPDITSYSNYDDTNTGYIIQTLN